MSKSLFNSDLKKVDLPEPALLNYYKDTERRLFWIVGPIDATIYELVQHIINCNYEDRNIPIAKRKPIRFVMSSPGGSLEIEQTLVSIMEISQTPIHCIAIGMCASAASMIYLAGHKRYATRSASFMFHQGGCENLEGSYQQILAFMEKYQMDIEEMAQFYNTHTSFSEELIAKKLNEGDWYISLDEAVENNIVHEVVEDMSVFM